MTTPALDARAILLDAMPEAELQRHVIDGLRARGYRVWHVVDSRLMSAGLPDIIAVKLGGPVLFWELKSSTGRLRPSQKRALDALASATSVDVRVVRPADWDAISGALVHQSPPPEKGARGTP